MPIKTSLEENIGLRVIIIFIIDDSYKELIKYLATTNNINVSIGLVKVKILYFCELFKIECVNKSEYEIITAII